MYEGVWQWLVEDEEHEIESLRGSLSICKVAGHIDRSVTDRVSISLMESINDICKVGKVLICTRLGGQNSHLKIKEGN